MLAIFGHRLSNERSALLTPVALFLGGVGIAILGLALLYGYLFVLRPRLWRRDLEQRIRAVEPKLLAYVRDVREGRIERDPAGRYPLPSFEGASGPTIEEVMMDSHGNVVFQTEHSLQWDVGVEHRNGSSEMNGTGRGTEITVDHLFDQWYDFDDFGP